MDRYIDKQDKQDVGAMRMIKKKREGVKKGKDMERARGGRDLQMKCR